MTNYSSISHTQRGRARAVAEKKVPFTWELENIPSTIANQNLIYFV
jgi:hypothetical protein